MQLFNKKYVTIIMASQISLPVLSGDTTIGSYISQINKFPYLTNMEEDDLAKKWCEDGDVKAAHKLVTSHLRLVVKIASNFKNYGLPMMDMIAEGNIGLMQAVKRFDHKKGFRLATYAMWWIKASIQEYVLHSWSLVKIGTTAAQKKLFFNLRKMKNQLKKVDNTNLSQDDVRTIAQRLDVSENEVVEMDSRLTQSDFSLNNPYSNNEESQSEMIDYLQDERESHEVILANNQDLMQKKAILFKALETLNEREKDIISQRKLKEPTTKLDELSKKYGISIERVRQIEKKAFEKMQKFIVEYVAS